jgi:hypothetical protein
VGEPDATSTHGKIHPKTIHGLFRDDDETRVQNLASSRIVPNPIADNRRRVVEGQLVPVNSQSVAVAR